MAVYERVSMKILLTGATGYIGKHVLKKLCRENNVTCIVRRHSDCSEIRNLADSLIILDNYKCLYEELDKTRPDVVVHLAGMFRGEHSTDTIGDMLESNIKFSCILFDAAQNAGCCCFINTGSYWQNYNGDTYNPVNLYAATKQAFEDIVLYYVKAKNCKAITLQIFDSFGPDDKRNKILNIVSRMDDGDTIQMSPGEQNLYFCYIEDIADAYECAIQSVLNMDNGTYRKYAVRGKDPHSLKQIIESYLKLSGRNIRIQWGGRPYRNREIMNPKGIGTILPGWTPKHSLEEGLKKYITKTREVQR